MHQGTTTRATERATQRPRANETPSPTRSTPGRRALPRLGALRRGAPAVVVAVAVQSVGNLVFHAVAGRGMPAAEYGALGALLAMMVLLAVPLSGLQTAASAAVAARGGSLTRGSTRRLVGVPTAVSLLPAAAVVAAAPGIQSWLHVEDRVAVVLLAPSLVAAVALSCVRGMLLGAGAPGAVATGYVASVSVRLVAVLALTPTVPVAIAGSLVGEVLATTLALVAVRRRARPGAPILLGRLRVARSVGALLVLFLFTSGDMFLARHHLLPDASGAYVAAATVAKTALALPAAAMAVLFPRLVGAWATTAPRRGVVRACGTVVALAAAGSAVIMTAPGLVLGLLFHDAYAGSSDLLRVLALTALLSSIVTVCVNSALARGSWAAVLMPLGGLLIEVAVITVRHEDALQVAWGSSLSALVTVLLAVVIESRALLCANGTRQGSKSAQTLRHA